MRRKALIIALSFLPHSFFAALTCWGTQDLGILYLALIGCWILGVLASAFMQFTAYVADALRTYPDLFRQYGLQPAEEAPNAFVSEILTLMVLMWSSSFLTLLATAYLEINPVHSFMISLAVVGIGATLLLDTKPSQ